jgi:hypothetical protein
VASLIAVSDEDDRQAAADVSRSPRPNCRWGTDEGTSTMLKKKTRDVLGHLATGERAQVLDKLLQRHPDLHDEATAIAIGVLEAVSREDVAEDVADLVTSIGYEELNGRAGKQPWGYVEPGEAAWELLEEAIEATKADMSRTFQAGMKAAAEEICMGIILGLHGVDTTTIGGALDYAPDFPAETAGDSMSSLMKLYPRSQRRAAGGRVVNSIKERAEDWVEMLNRVVDQEAATEQHGGT